MFAIGVRVATRDARLVERQRGQRGGRRGVCAGNKEYDRASTLFAISMDAIAGVSREVSRGRTCVGSEVGRCDRQVVVAMCCDCAVTVTVL